MRPLVLLSGPASTWTDFVFWATLVEAMALAAFFFGHMQRGLCADVPGLCPPFPLQSLLLALLILPHLISVVGGIFLAFGANSSYNKMLVAVAWLTILFDLGAILFRLFLPRVEDAGFALFASIVVWILFATAIVKLVAVVGLFKWLRYWEVRALTTLRTTLGSQFLVDRLASVEKKLAFSRDWVHTLILVSLVLAALYGFGMLIFLMIPGAGMVFSSRIFFLLMVLALPLVYSWLIYMAVVGLPDWEAQVKNFGTVQLALPVLRGALILSVVHTVLGVIALILHLRAAIMFTADTNLVVVIYSYALASVAVLNLASYVMAVATIVLYSNTTNDFIEDIPRKLQGKTPRFPLMLKEEGESEVTTGNKDPYTAQNQRNLYKETLWTDGPLPSAPPMTDNLDFFETMDLPDSGPEDQQNFQPKPSPITASMRRRVTFEGGAGASMGPPTSRNMVSADNDFDL